MKRINEYKKLFNIEGPIDLKQLKTTYRNLVKEWHPDKFREGDELAKEAEEKSAKIIDGYHFLVSIAPETIAANLEEYTKTATESGIADFQYKNQVMEITFLDGNTYEYFGVSKNTYTKFLSAENTYRFARRNILRSHFDKYLHGGVECSGNLRSKSHDISQIDRLLEGNAVSRSSDNDSVGVLLRSYSCHDIHPVHQSASHQIVERIGVIGQNHLGHDGNGFFCKLLLRHKI